MDLVGFAGAGDGATAYAAHLGGYAAGLLTGISLLVLGRTTGDDVDALWMFKQWRRRQAARATLSQSTRSAPMTPPPKADDTTPDSVMTTAHWLREVEAGMRSDQLEGAMRRWKREAPDAPEACLPAAPQLDLANHLQAAGDWTTAADAYRRFLHHHPDHAEAPMVRLLLGVLLARRLHRTDEAKALLEQAREELRDPAHVQLADTVLLEGKA